MEILKVKLIVMFEEEGDVDGVLSIGGKIIEVCYDVFYLVYVMMELLNCIVLVEED